MVVGSLNPLQKIGALLARGRAVQAEAACRVFARQQPDHAGAAHLLGVLSLTGGRHAEAMRLLKKATRLDPGNFHYWKDFGMALLSKHKLGEARESLQRALALRPADPEVARHLGECLCQLDEYEAALKIFEGVPAGSADAATTAAIRLFAGIAKLKTWRLEAAIEDLRRVTPRHLGYPDAQLSLMIARFATGDVPGAIRAAKILLRVNPQPETLSFLCRIFHYDTGAGRGKIAAADCCVRSALTIPISAARISPSAGI